MAEIQELAEDDNWLNRETVVCPSCETRLVRVDHSPFYDCWFFYCDQCPRYAEVSFYDSEVGELGIADRIVTVDPSGPMWNPKLIEGIEARLRPCDCGGSYRHRSSRRCFACHAIVLEGRDAEEVDVWSTEEEKLTFMPGYQPPDSEKGIGMALQSFGWFLCRKAELWKR